MGRMDEEYTSKDVSGVGSYDASDALDESDVLDESDESKDVSWDGAKKISLKMIREAGERLQGIIERTELVRSLTFSEISGSDVYLKPENLQRTGSFKIRGAYNKVSSLSAGERERGIIACSAGNHAQGVALAGSWDGLRATIVMPRGAPLAKIAATRGYGAEVVLAGEDYDGAYHQSLQLQRETGAVFIHPFDDPEIIAGQGTIGLEILAELPDADAILVPIGGGGLISGIAAAALEINPALKIIGVEAAGAPSMQVSLSKDRLTSIKTGESIADGISVKTPGRLTFELCRQYLEEVVSVSEEEIAGAILLLLERAKLLAEGAGAVALAALLYRKVRLEGRKVVVLISGGNIDVNILSRIIERGLVKAGRRVRLRTVIKDKPGHLQGLLTRVAELEANVLSVKHNHFHPGIPMDMAEVELELETREKGHADSLKEVLELKGYPVEVLLKP